MQEALPKTPDLTAVQSMAEMAAFMLDLGRIQRRRPDLKNAMATNAQSLATG
jgi:hypothetical protein